MTPLLASQSPQPTAHSPQLSRRKGGIEMQNQGIDVWTELAAKAKGVKFGNPKIGAAQTPAVAAVKAEADRPAGNILPIVAEIQKSGATTLRAVAEALNAGGVPTPRGGRWHAGAFAM